MDLEKNGEDYLEGAHNQRRCVEKSTRGKTADRHYTEKAEKLVWTYPARRISPADSDRRQNDWQKGGRKTKNENDRLDDGQISRKKLRTAESNGKEQTRMATLESRTCLTTEDKKKKKWRK